MNKLVEIKKKKGFTLVELVIVVAIIGILIAIAVPKFADATRTAKNRKVEANARMLSSAVMTWYADKGVYPDRDDSLDLFKNAGIKEDAGYSYLPNINSNDNSIWIKYDSRITKFKYSGNADNVFADIKGTAFKGTENAVYFRY